MPSPLGHALAGAAAGWLVSGSAAPHAGRRFWVVGAAFAALGMFPDLDLLFTLHRGPTHSIGAALIAGALAWAVTRHFRLAVAAAIAYVTHPLLDWLSEDSSLPLGVMALWPLSTDFHKATVQLFDSIWRRYETPDFWSHNAIAIARELAILAPPFVLALRLQRRTGRSESPGRV